MAGIFELVSAGSRDFKFLLRSETGRVIIQSVEFNTKMGCEKELSALKQYARTSRKNIDEKAWDYELIQETESSYYFQVRTASGDIVAKSDNYKTRTGCKNGIAAVKKNAPIAKIVDMTD